MILIIGSNIDTGIDNDNHKDDIYIDDNNENDIDVDDRVGEGADNDDNNNNDKIILNVPLHTSRAVAQCSRFVTSHTFQCCGKTYDPHGTPRQATPRHATLYCPAVIPRVGKIWIWILLWKRKGKGEGDEMGEGGGAKQSRSVIGR